MTCPVANVGITIVAPFHLCQVTATWRRSISAWSSRGLQLLDYMVPWTLNRYVRLRVAHVPGILGTFSSPLRVSDPDRQLAVSFEVGGGENVPDIPGACATRNFTYLVRGPWNGWCWTLGVILDIIVFTYNSYSESNCMLFNPKYWWRSSD